MLTGMPNRWVIADLVDDWLATPAPVGDGGGAVGLALLDLDRFKVINESLGHSAGDRLLIAVGARLQTAIDATGGSLGRLGGDEFVAVWPDVADVDATLMRARRLVETLLPPFTVEGMVQVTASVGVIHVAQGTCGAAEALRRAEEAMYRAKSKGGNLVETDDERHFSRLAVRVREENELRAALRGGDVVAWYQGEWELDTGRLAGAEALARWVHPHLGVRDAVEFVRLAEDIGVVQQLGDMMLRTAFEALDKWRPLIVDTPFVLRVNVSAMQLRDESLLEKLSGLLAEYRVDPQLVCLELTESSLLGDPDAAAAMLARIRALGIGLAIDDFGTGYSSLLYLKRLPLTGLKIDRAFVAGLPEDPIDGAVVAAVVALAQRLGVTVTAEGLESEAQMRAVLDLGCMRAQGYHLSRPETGDLFEARLAAGAHLHSA
jgi:diguanylate cyclase (GGDEF)-like protein